MRIVYDYQIFFIQAYGGVSRYFSEIAARIPAIAGDKTLIMAPLHFNEYLPRFNSNAFGLKIPRIPKTHKIAKIANDLVGALATEASAPDILHETYFFGRPGRLPRTRRAKTVLTVYDMIHEKFSDSFPPSDVTSKCKRQAVERADHVLCISHSTRADLVELFGVDESKTSVTHLGFSLSATAKPARRTSEGAPFLLYVGQRRGYKNFERFLRAYAASERLKRDFTVQAFGGGAFTPEEVALVRELGLNEGQIRQLGGDDDLLAGLYAQAAALVYPSLYEGFGLPPLEAMANDCPAVCARSSSIPEVAGDAAEYFDPYSVEDMTRAMENVLYSESRRRELVALGRRRIEQFTWDACARRTRDVYASLL